MKHKRTDRYFTHGGSGGRSRGLKPYYPGRGIFAPDRARHSATKPLGGSDFLVGARFAGGTFVAEGKTTIGLFGGLAVFTRALTPVEMRASIRAPTCPRRSSTATADQQSSDSSRRYVGRLPQSPNNRIVPPCSLSSASKISVR